MKKFIQNIKNIWKVEELRKRLLVTLSLILVYRVGCHIVLPGVDPAILSAESTDNAGTIEGLLGLLSGGGFTNASFFALGIMPYISASIIMQLLGMAVPAVQKMQNEGEVRNYALYICIDYNAITWNGCASSAKNAK